MSAIPNQSNVVFKTGWLRKRGKVHTAWKRRYFALTFENKLEYYLEEERINKRGFISIRALKSRCMGGVGTRSVQKRGLSSSSDDQDDEKARTFTLETTKPNRLWEFLAETRQDRRDWVQAINLVYSDCIEPDKDNEFSKKKSIAKDLDDDAKENNKRNSTYELNDFEPEVYIVTDEELSDENERVTDPLSELQVAIRVQHGGDALKWTIHALAQKVPPEKLFLEFYKGQMRPNWNSRFGGYWEEILTTFVNSRIDPDCIVEDRTFFHILAKDHHRQVYDALWNLGPSITKKDSRQLSVLDYFIRTSTAFITRDMWWDTFKAIVRYGYHSASLEKSFRQLRYQLDQKKLSSPQLLAIVERAEAFPRSWEKKIRNLASEVPPGFRLKIEKNIGVNHLILLFGYGIAIDLPEATE